MEIHTDISLKNYTTMKLGGNARFIADIHTPEDVATACQNAKKQNIPIFVLGGGSNTIVKDSGYNGLVLRNKILGRTIIAEDSSTVTYDVGAGESWDSFVQETVKNHLSGVEAMSGIPGTCGAAPVQNIGAYGQELADTFISLTAYDKKQRMAVTLDADACHFSYRSSIFRTTEVDRYIILSIRMRLYKNPPTPPFYAALEKYFNEHAISVYTPEVIRDAVLAIRKDKLPDPTVLPNAGSFFKNAVVEDWQYNDLLKEYPDMPSFDMPNKTHKIPTGWLIEQAGLKGSEFYGMKVHDKNALVLINASATSYSDLDAARMRIINTVRDKFRITIEQEPLEI